MTSRTNLLWLQPAFVAACASNEEVCLPSSVQLARAPSLSKRNEREYHRWPSGVHSTNTTSATSMGFNHRQSFIFSAVSPTPWRPAFSSGRLAHAHLSASRP